MKLIDEFFSRAPMRVFADAKPMGATLFLRER